MEELEQIFSESFIEKIKECLTNLECIEIDEEILHSIEEDLEKSDLPIHKNLQKYFSKKDIAKLVAYLSLDELLT